MRIQYFEILTIFVYTNNLLILHTAIKFTIAYNRYYFNILIIAVRPTITVTPGRRVNALEGNSLTLGCTADGIPEPNVAWKKINEYGKHLI